MKFPKLRYAYSVEQAAEWAEEWCEDTRKWLEGIIESCEEERPDVTFQSLRIGCRTVAEEILERLKE